MKWRGHFYAHYYGTKLVKDWDGPDHVMDPCPEPTVFHQRLYRGSGGYEKALDQTNDKGNRWVVFESDSGEWHLFGVKEEDCG